MNRDLWSSEDCDNFKDRSTFQVNLLDPIMSFHWDYSANLFEMWVVHLGTEPLQKEKEADTMEVTWAWSYSWKIRNLKDTSLFMETLLSSAPIREI